MLQNLLCQLTTTELFLEPAPSITPAKVLNSVHQDSTQLEMLRLLSDMYSDLKRSHASTNRTLLAKTSTIATCDPSLKLFIMLLIQEGTKQALLDSWRLQP